ncbi:hypothetical protein F4819DRAFT_484534 [Hypoxylon fuscum]|nr:hypothetical protein F4819DRAFT_484534 [Hypoxylon fuscum]
MAAACVIPAPAPALPAPSTQSESATGFYYSNEDFNANIMQPIDLDAQSLESLNPIQWAQSAFSPPPIAAPQYEENSFLGTGYAVADTQYSQFGDTSQACYPPQSEQYDPSLPRELDEQAIGCAYSIYEQPVEQPAEQPIEVHYYDGFPDTQQTAESQLEQLYNFNATDAPAMDETNAVVCTPANTFVPDVQVQDESMLGHIKTEDQ